MSLDDSDRNLHPWAATWFGLLLCVGLYLWFALTKSFVADDSYFYVVIARNLATKGVQTFSNLFPTNGIHPLWCYVLAGYTYLVHAAAPSAVNHLAYGVPLAIALLAGTTIQCWRMSRALELDPVVITVLVIGFIVSLGNLYSEGPLFFLLLTTLLAMMARDPKLAETRPLVFGLITAAIVLARLDAIFFIGFVYLYYLWDVGLKPRPAIGAIVCGSIVSAYVLTNMYFFGGAMPVSGWLKGNFPYPFLRGFEFDKFPRVQSAAIGGYSLLLGWMPIVVGLLTLLICRPKVRMQRVFLLLLFGGTAFQGAYIALFTRSHTLWPWYYVLPLVLLAVSLAVIVPRWERLYARTVILSCISAAIIASYVEKVAQQDSNAFLTIDYLNRHKISGETIMVSDWPGAVAYYTDNNVLAADMLTSNRFEFERMRQQSNALDFLIAECKRLQKPLRHIMIVGNSWLLWDDKTQEITYYDPRRYPVMVPIGKITTHYTPTGGLECDGNIPVWLGPENSGSKKLEANADR